MSMTPDTFDLVARLHPMRGQPLFTSHPEGATLAEIVEGVGIDPRFRSTVQVVISGEANSAAVPFEQWHLVRPRAGSHVLVTPRVHGTLAALALSAALPHFATTVAGTWFGLTAGSFAYAATYAAVTVVGSLLINALIPPPDAPQLANQETNYSITGAGNAENRYGVYPTVLGRHQIYPPKTARGYTEGEGDTIYFRGRFTFGYGPVALETLRIGTTPITEFEGVELEFLNVDQAETLAHMPDLAPMVTAWRQGNEAMSLYPDDVAEDAYNVALNQDEPVVRVTRDRATSVSVDVTYNGLIKYDDKGRSLSETEEVKFRFRKIGDPIWTEAGTETHTGQTSASLRFTKEMDLPAAGQYEVEVTRLTADREESSVRDEPFLTAVRSVQSGALPSHEHIAEVALRIKASEQLNGQLADLNGIALQMAPVWDGASWSAPQPVRHPAWVYARALMGPMLEKPIPEAKIQLEDLREWAQQEPHWTCDAVIDQSSTVAQVLDIICATGRARRVLRDLKYSIIRDGGTGPIVQQFTPRNSYGFEGLITFPKDIHGFRVRCISERLEWQQDEITVYADGYDASNATDFETLDLTGVVLGMDETEGNPWRLGRYHLAQAVLRPEEFSWQSDMDHLACNMGDKVRLVHDVPMIGVGVGRIKEVQTNAAGNITALTLDEAFSLDGSAYRLIIREAPGYETVVDAAPPASWGGQWIPSGTVSGAGVAVGDLVQVVEMGQEGLEVLITSITHSGNMQARLTGVAAAPEVLQADQGEIPAYVPTITAVVPRETLLPAAPRILSAVVEVGTDPVAVQWVGKVVPQDRYTSTRIRAVLSDQVTGAEVSRQEFTSTEVRVTLPEVKSYSLRLYAIDSSGRPSDAALLEVTREAEAVRPDTVTGFGLRILGDQAHLTWDDLGHVASHYVIRHLPLGSSGGWNEAVDIERAVKSTSIAVPALAGSYLIKAVGHWGHHSLEASMILSTISELTGYNVVRDVSLHPEFEGDLGAGLSVTPRGLQFLPDGVSGQNGYSATFVSSRITDLGAVMTSRLTAVLKWYAFDQGDLWSAWGLWQDVEYWAGGEVLPASLRLQISTTAEDPTAPGATWSDWSDFLIGDYLARGYRFRVVFEASDFKVSPVLQALTVTIDVPDRIIEGVDIDCPAAGVMITFDPPFLERPAIAVGGQGLPVNARSIRTQQSKTGFHQQFLDDQGQGIACTLDYIAKGFGRLQQ